MTPQADTAETPHGTGLGTAAGASEEDLRFRLDVALDLEHERLLLYRTVLVLELIAGGLLLRQLLLHGLPG